MGRGMRELLNGLGWVIAVSGCVSLVSVGLCGSVFIQRNALFATEVGCGVAVLVGIAMLCLVPRKPSQPPDADKTP